MASDVPVIVVGAGISGLACGHFLKQAGIQALIFEATDQPGGCIRSTSQDGFLVEEGPQSFTGTDLLLEMIDDLQIDGQLVRANPRAPRYVLVNGTLLPVPLSPPALLTTPLLSRRSKWSLLRDAFGRTRPPEPDESIAAFVRRKFTEEMLERLVGPFVSGIFAGDPEQLSLRAAFPTIYEMERQYRSIIRGAMRSRRNSAGERPTLSSFKSGNAALVRALAESLGGSLQCGACVSAVLHERANGRAGFGVQVETRARAETLRCDALILAAEPNTAGRLLKTLSADFGRLLGDIEYAPVAVVALGYPQKCIRRPLNGFGFLVPRKEGLRVLGTVWNSALFPGRAPEGDALMTSFVGGMTDPASASLDPAALVETTHADLAPLLGIDGPPKFRLVKQYARALPQYNLGHTARIAALESLCDTLPGLWLAGNYLEGPAIGACVRRAQRVAQRAQDFLASGQATRPS